MSHSFRSRNVMFLNIIFTNCDELGVVVLEVIDIDVLHQAHHGLCRNIVEISAEVTSVEHRTESCVVETFVCPKTKISNIKPTYLDFSLYKNIIKQDYYLLKISNAESSYKQPPNAEPSATLVPSAESFRREDPKQDKHTLLILQFSKNDDFETFETF